MTRTPLPGSFGLSRIGLKPDGSLEVLGQIIAGGMGILGDGSRYTHAFMVLDNDEVIEAMPSGARIVPLADRLNDPGVRFCDAPVMTTLAEEVRNPITWGDDVVQQVSALLERLIREDVVLQARALVGTPYGFSDYLALALAHLGIRPKWLRRRIASNKRLICSQLVDLAYERAGIHLFTDGRLPADVTPGDLDDYRVRNLEGAQRS